jgi:hypothetical protein
LGIPAGESFLSDFFLVNLCKIDKTLGDKALLVRRLAEAIKK